MLLSDLEILSAMVQNVKCFEENVIEMSSPNIHVLNSAFFFGPFQHQKGQCWTTFCQWVHTMCISSQIKVSTFYTCIYAYMHGQMHTVFLWSFSTAERIKLSHLLQMGAYIVYFRPNKSLYSCTYAYMHGQMHT